MKDYLAKSGRVAMPDQKKLLGVLKAQKVLLYAPLLKWYHEHGLEITAVHRTIDCIPRKIFNGFVQEVANMRRKGDVKAEKALLAEKKSFWATAPTASSLKLLSVRQK